MRAVGSGGKKFQRYSTSQQWLKVLEIYKCFIHQASWCTPVGWSIRITMSSRPAWTESIQRPCLKKKITSVSELGVVGHTCDPSTQEVEAEGSQSSKPAWITKQNPISILILLFRMWGVGASGGHKHLQSWARDRPGAYSHLYSWQLTYSRTGVSQAPKQPLLDTREQRSSKRNGQPDAPNTCIMFKRKIFFLSWKWGPNTQKSEVFWISVSFLVIVLFCFLVLGIEIHARFHAC